MVLLFVGGVIDLLWIAALAMLVLLEKVLPFGRLIARLAGIAYSLSAARGFCCSYDLFEW